MRDQKPAACAGRICQLADVRQQSLSAGHVEFPSGRMQSAFVSTSQKARLRDTIPVPPGYRCESELITLFADQGDSVKLFDKRGVLNGPPRASQD